MSDELKNGCTPSDCASCGLDCGSNSSTENHNTITLTLDDDTEIECAILTVFPVDAQEYIALLPLDENGQNQDGEVYLYKFSRTEKGDPILANIESDDEDMQKLPKLLISYWTMHVKQKLPVHRSNNLFYLKENGGFRHYRLKPPF